MGWIGLSLFFTAIIIGIVHYFERQPIKEWVNTDEYIIAAFIGGFFSLIIVAFIGGMYSGIEDGRDIDNPNCKRDVNHWEIVSAVRDKTTSASFILGTGGINTIDKYYVYRQEPQGLLLTTYNAKTTYVIEQDGQPAYERIDYVCPQPVYDFLWWSSGNEHRNVGREGTLYVPRDTILREFKL